MSTLKTMMILIAGMLFWLLTATPSAVAAEKKAEYVGSDKCADCHMDEYNKWQASGHPWKLRKADKARYAKLPLPPGYSWDDISYVIGGANWKARYIDKNGFIITTAKDGSEAKTQYNLEDGSWAFYHKGEKKPYKCGPCHMTGYSKEGHQDGLPGLIGTWKEDGVGCEECHGPGSIHAAEKEPTKKTILVDKTAKACGKCHQRGGINNKPPVKGGFIRHHEQINELLAGGHADQYCTECHDSHGRANMIKESCESCHDDKPFLAYAAGTLHGKTGVTCMECHMPKASKSAIKVSNNVGDIRTHIFNINVDPAANMFETVTKDGKKSTYAKGFVTLNFSCLGCHGGRDLNWAAKNAKNFHNIKK